MSHLRSRLIAVVITFPLLMIALVAWSIADDPTVEPQYWGAGNNTVPVWQLAGLTIRACLPLLALAIVVGAVVVAAWQAHRQRPLAAAANRIAAATVVIGAVAAVYRHASQPDSPAAPYLLALVIGLLVGVAILANAAARAKSDRRTARLVVVPTTLVAALAFTMFAALVAYATDLIIHGVPLLDPALGAHVYPIDALPPGDTGLVPELIVSMAASLAALTCAAYALTGIIRGARFLPVGGDRVRDNVIELDVASS
jgi:hypothetical protein